MEVRIFKFASFTRYGHFIQFRYMPSYQYLFRVSYQNILLVTRISIPLLGSQVKNIHHLHSRHLASYLVYRSEGVVRV
jgi:hypothetical protein